MSQSQGMNGEILENDKESNGKLRSMEIALMFVPVSV
jgi:hypothetical protein